MPSLLPAAFRLVDEGLMDLPAAIRMLTVNAARAVGLPDLNDLPTFLKKYAPE